MLFRRKPRNRRLNRSHVLDVKVRSARRQGNTFRLAALSFSVSLIVLLGLLLIWRGGRWVVSRVGPENPAFAVKEIDLQTDGVIALEQLRRWSGVRVGENLLALDLSRVKRDLELVPVIESASVERVLPGTLRIRIAEREPIAQFIFPQPRAGRPVERGVYTFDLQGYVMLPLDPRQLAAPGVRSDDLLPVIIGLPVSQLRLGRRVEQPQVYAALRLIAAFDRSPLSGQMDLKQIDVSAPDILQVTTAQGSEVTFGTGDFEAPLRRWRAVAEFGTKAGRLVGTIDLSVSNNVPVRWLEASALPPVTPKPNKVSRKKNV
jgi:cell division septal protein FtsQ